MKNFKKKTLFCFFIIIVLSMQDGAASEATDSNILRIKAAAEYPEILEGHLKMGTPDGPDGINYGVNSLYFTRNGRPWLPVMGEVHYARVPNQYWEDSILAMKAGGVDIIATYIFWIFHEETQGQYNWDGDCDLRRFIELCKKHDMPLWIRIGPWCHGEARNGGFPDWLGNVCEPRTMDPAYFEQVRRWYTAVASQVNGLYHKDGGPIIGIQFDNEFGHVGGRGGEPYILKCKQIALGLGMDVPYYSVTGWGGAWVPKDEVLPVQGSYVDPFWAAGTEQLPPFEELLFSDLISLVINTNVASDMVTDRIRQLRWRYDPSRYPYATAELGGGMHHKILRRPTLDSVDTEAMALCRLGEGANMIGYYMYHGGSQPLGRTGRLVEGGMPLVSYDFQAPLQEFGKTNASYYSLKRLHQFIHDFGGELAEMTPTLPDDRPKADDPGKLRYALRSKGERGFLFFNNHQRYLDMPNRENIKFAVTLGDNEVIFPDESMTIPSKSVGIFPLNLPVADATLVYTTAQPLMRWRDEDVTRLILTNLPGIETQLNITGTTGLPGETGRISQVTTAKGAKIEILILSEQESLNAWKINIAGKRYMAICPIELWQSGDSLKLRTTRSDSTILRIYPATDQAFIYEGEFIRPQKESDFSIYHLPAEKLPQVLVTSQENAEVPAEDKNYPFVKADAPPKAWRIRIGEIDWNSVSDVCVNFEYIGDMARLYLNGRLVADNFWSKPNWQLWLKRWQKELSEPDSELILVISPWLKDQRVFVQKRPDVTKNLTAELLGIKTSAERSFTLGTK
ncbi:MAG: beta-galactosidase [Sedimentisphaerales bacterium]|nr:beta-galactosidase [Sedimentisphaerales bacterium]